MISHVIASFSVVQIYDHLSIHLQHLFSQTLCPSRKPYWKVFASKTFNIREELSPSFCFAVLTLTQENVQMADCVWNYPIIHSRSLIIDYIMYAYGLFFCYVWCMQISGDQKFAFSNYFVPIIIYWPLSFVFRDNSGPEVKFYSWNTVPMYYLSFVA